MRVKLAARGGGRWQGSGGYRSKFGLTVAEVLRGLEELQGAAACRTASSSCTSTSAARFRTSASSRGRSTRRPGSTPSSSKAGAGLRVPRRRRRARRRLRRLADQLRIERQLHPRGIRQRRRLSHPDRVRRRGREASDDRVGERPRDRGVPQRPHLQRARRVGVRRGEDPRHDQAGRSGAAAHRSARDLSRTCRARNALESYHDAQQALDMALNLFTGGYLPLEQRCQAENLYWAILVKLQEARRADGRRAGGPAGPRRHDGRHVFLQLLAVPVVSRTAGRSSSSSR